jgi:hypothetical protein
MQTGVYLASLVDPYTAALGGHWLAALRDYAYVSLPNEFGGQVPVCFGKTPNF